MVLVHKSLWYNVIIAWRCASIVKLIRNLKELGKALNDMSDETFHYHSGVERKDFSKWVREVVGDEKLANDLSKAKSRIQTSQAVAQRISFLEGRI